MRAVWRRVVEALFSLGAVGVKRESTTTSSTPVVDRCWDRCWIAYCSAFVDHRRDVGPPLRAAAANSSNANPSAECQHDFMNIETSPMSKRMAIKWHLRVVRCRMIVSEADSMVCATDAGLAEVASTVVLPCNSALTFSHVVNRPSYFSGLLVRTSSLYFLVVVTNHTFLAVLGLEHSRNLLSAFESLPKYMLAFRPSQLAHWRTLQPESYKLHQFALSNALGPVLTLNCSQHARIWPR